MATASAPLDPQYEVVREGVAYKRYMTVYDREVKHPDGATHAYDIVGHPRSDFHFVRGGAWNPNGPKPQRPRGPKP